MKIGKACAIFMQIQSDKFTAEEKGLAIYHVLDMPTHYGITKDKMLDVIRYLFNMLYDVEPASKEKEAPAEWQGDEYDGYSPEGFPIYDTFRCSKCGESIEDDGSTLPNFCPNCGADMRQSKR